MKNKDTDGLRQELMDSPDLTQFLSQNEELFANKSVAGAVTALWDRRALSETETRRYHLLWPAPPARSVHDQ